MRVTIMVVILALTPTAFAQHSTESDEHHAGVTQRGDQAMGFSHENTTHHFRLYKDGGAIEITANSSKDTDSRDMIRHHLAHIAKMFAAGNFNTPMFIHDANPPGAATMTELRDSITYTYQDVASGGHIRITTRNARALDAVHRFLRFQITEHNTGDSTQLQSSPAGNTHP
jgi:hypothetical protein